MVIHKYNKQILSNIFMLCTILFSGISQNTALANNQIRNRPSSMEMLFADLTPEEKVGQLFLITFNGFDTSPAAPIFDLIVNYHIGGVVLDRSNENFTDPSNIPADCWSLVNGLQQIEHDSSRFSNASNPSFGSKESEYIPLFIGISQEGDRSFYTELITGLSPIPSQMALGATWNPELAEQIGKQVGRELSSLGINLLFGPSLDVVSNSSPGQSDLGVRSFGGDPYWVGKFGQAFIRGVHKGSLNNIAVVGKYFPGLGSSDRLPEEEVATVRKSLEQLKQIDLAPFFAVTGNAPSPEQAVDALLNSHIRYQGLQGNIRSTTRPISLDPQAFELLMSLEPLSTWRDAGGLIISDNLGSQAIQQLYDPSGESFNLSRVAVDAFIAGNDILFLGNLGLDNKPVPDHEISATIDFFVQKYKEDQDFADKVDASVIRILNLKNKVYSIFTISTVLTSENTLSALGNSTTAEEVSRQSATLINPSISELGSTIQDPPSFYDRMVILSDTESFNLCDDCLEISTFSYTSLEDAIIKLYGPISGRQIGRANINSYSFRDLTNLLDFPSESEQMVTDLYNANWIIIASLGLSSERPYSDALTRLLSERQDLLQDKKIIVFSLGAPYYLDATNISKISAYFALFTKLSSSLDVAARILFKEFPNPPGSLPVSVPGINYDLISATSPDPNQSFLIYVGTKPDLISTSESASSNALPPVYRVEDLIDLYTEIILDHNGNPVPDGTPVNFILTTKGISSPLPQVTTINGSALTSFLVQEPDNIIVHAESSLASSISIEIRILGDIEITVTENTEETPEIIPDASPTASEAQNNLDPLPPSNLDTVNPVWKLWLFSLILMVIISLIAYRLGAIAGMVREGIIRGISSIIGGLFIYNYVLLNLPGIEQLFPDGLSTLSVGIIVSIGSLSGWALAFIYQQVMKSPDFIEPD